MVFSTWKYVEWNWLHLDQQLLEVIFGWCMGYLGADVGSDHYLHTGKVCLRLKRMPQKKGTKPFATEKLEDRATVDAYCLTLSERFRMLDADSSIADRCESFKSVVKDVAAETTGRRREPSHENWISDETWRLIDERKKVKVERDQMCSADKRSVKERSMMIWIRLSGRGVKEKKNNG